MTVESPAKPQSVHVARQPILDLHGQVFGYELLYRSGETATACVEGLDLAGARVLTDSVLNIGLDNLTGGRKAFMNLTRSLLVGEFGTLVPPSMVVFELLESIEADAEVIDACRTLKAAGYALALDDFVPRSGAERLLPYVKFVKVDVLAIPAAGCVALAQRLLPRGITLLAEKVETNATFEQTAKAGYTLFQGYFFCKPKTMSSGALPTARLAHLQVLAAINQRDISIAAVENLVKHEASLSYRLLRCVNSAASGLLREIHSIKQAIVLLGIDQIRKWASVWALAGINGQGTPEVVTVAVLRARCCERLGNLLGQEDSSELFLLGLCSLLDTMLGRPLSTVLDGLPLSTETRQALLGEDNTARRVLDAVILHERGEWDKAADAAIAAGLEPSDLGSSYAEALKWAHELTQTGIAAPIS